MRDEEPPVRRCDWRGRWIAGDPRAVPSFCRCCPRKGWRIPHRKPRFGLPGAHYVRTSRDVRQGR